MLRLTPVNPDTFDALTYLAIVPSFAPRAPAPPGHRFVGSTYSVRASGGITETARPMFLDLHFTEADLAGADPHTLALFAWDEAGGEWKPLGGQLDYRPGQNRLVGVATRRFTTYALMATPAWHDEFDDFDFSGLSERSNVDLGPLEDGTGLILVDTPGSGVAISRPISPTTAFAGWDQLTFAGFAIPPTTTLAVDVLSITGTAVLSNVVSGASLAEIDPARYPVLKLRARLASAQAGATPALDAWRLTWRAEATEPVKPPLYVYVPLVLR
jgi:hypothetical protein